MYKVTFEWNGEVRVKRLAADSEQDAYRKFWDMFNEIQHEIRVESIERE
jgi:hypothetical protein